MHAADTDNLNKTGKYNDSKAIVNKDIPNMKFLVKKTITRRNPKDMKIFNTTYFQNVQENSSREDWFFCAAETTSE